jgi:hypothetical protein
MWQRLTFFIGGVRVGQIGHLAVARAARILAKELVLKAVSVCNVMERHEGEYKLVVTNEGMVMG